MIKVFRLSVEVNVVVAMLRLSNFIAVLHALFAKLNERQSESGKNFVMAVIIVGCILMNADGVDIAVWTVDIHEQKN